MDKHEECWPLVIGAVFNCEIVLNSSVVRNTEKARPFALSLTMDLASNIFIWDLAFRQNGLASTQI